MTRRRFVLALLGTAVVSVAATFLAIKVFEDEPSVEGAASATLQSAVLGEKREYFVHLPEGYDSDTKRGFPVVYVLDGTSQSGHTAVAASLLARVGLIPPMIVVGVPSINGDTRNRDYTPPDMRLDTDADAGPKGAADRFLSHLETELIPRIEKDYRTVRPRMLAGWSRGGLTVVHSQIASPAMFDARFAHSPALWRENNLIVNQIDRLLSASSTLEGFLFLSIGERENVKMTAAFKDAVGTLERAARPAFRWKAYTSAQGSHESNPRLSTPVGLCAFFNQERSCGPDVLAVRPEDQKF